MTRLVELEQVLRVPPDPIRRLAALTITGTGADAAAILKLSNAERDRLIAMTAPRPLFAVGDPTSVRRQVYDLGNASALDLLLVDWAAGLPRESPEIDWQRAYEIVRDWRRPDFPLTGGDAKGLGIEPGPEIGRLMRDVEEWWIAGDFISGRPQCLDELKRRVEKMR
jgi:poly(A) polymerase